MKQTGVNLQIISIFYSIKMVIKSLVAGINLKGKMNETKGNKHD